jgi:hypothetical protein
MLTCQNPTCGKNFTVPLKTLNLQENPSETFFAFPFCLTEIKIVEEAPLKAEEKHGETEEPKIMQTEDKEKTKTGEKPAGCQYHPGYLSERSSKEQIPDECLICKDIVDCMLRKMRE